MAASYGVTFLNSSSAASSTTITTTTANEIVAVVLATYNASPGATAATFNGTAMTLRKQSPSTTSGCTYSFYDILVPTAGSYTFSWSFTANYSINFINVITIRGATLTGASYNSAGNSVTTVSAPDVTGGLLVGYDQVNGSIIPTITSDGETFTSLSANYAGNTNGWRFGYLLATSTATRTLTVTADYTSSSLAAFYPGNNPPNTPTSVVPAAGAATRSTGSLAVSAVVSDPDGNNCYALFRYSTDSAFGSYTDLSGSTVASGGTSTATLTGLATNTHYYMRVFANDGSVFSGFASTDFYTDRPPTAPAVTFPNGGETVNAAFQVTWTAATDPDGDTLIYDADYSTDNGSTWTNFVTGTSVLTATWDASGAAASTTARVRVRSRDPGGLTSAYAQSASAFTISHPAAVALPVVGGNYRGVILADNPTAYWSLANNDPRAKWFTQSIAASPTTAADFDNYFIAGASTVNSGVSTLGGQNLQHSQGIGWNESNTISATTPWAKPTYLPATTFAWQVDGTLTAATPGVYGFIVRGDDAHDLFIDGVFVCGTYGAQGMANSVDPTVTPATDVNASVRLSAGPHTFRFRQQDGAGGNGAIMAWKPPGATAYVVVPRLALGAPSDLTGQNHYLNVDNITGTIDYYEGALPGTEDYLGVYATGGGRLTSPDAVDMRRVVYSVECWVKPTAATGNFRILMSKGAGGIPGRNPAVYINPTNGIHHTQETSTPAAGQVYINDAAGLVQDAWNHVVCTCSGNGGKLEVYINGVLSASHASGDVHVGSGTGSWPSANVLTTNTAPFYIGNIYNTDTIGGIDEVAYYPYVLTANQVAAHFEMGLVSGFKGYQRAVMQEKPTAYYSRKTDARYWYDETHNSGNADFADPSSISGLATWLDATVLGLADGATVTSVSSRAASASTVNWLALATYGGPVFRNGGINGKSYLQQTAATGNGLYWDVDYSNTSNTVFVVARNRTPATGQRIFSGYRNNWLLGWWGAWSGVAYGSGWINDNTGSGTNGRLSPPSSSLLAFTWPFTVTGTNTGSSTLLQNGVQQTITSATAATNGPNGLSTSGATAQFGNTEKSDADVYECIVYNRVLTSAEIDRVNSYLGNKYGTFTVTPPAFQHAVSQTPGPVTTDGTASNYMSLTGDSASMPDAPRLRLAGPATFEAWVYPTQRGTRQSILQKTLYNAEIAWSYETDGTVTAYWGDGTNYDGFSSPVIPTNAWTHLVFIRGTSWATTYWVVNGVNYPAGSTASGGGTAGWALGYGHSVAGNGGTFLAGSTGTGPLTIGTGYVAPFSGQLAEVALYPKAISVAAAQAHYALGVGGGAYPGAGGYGG